MLRSSTRACHPADCVACHREESRFWRDDDAISCGWTEHISRKWGQWHTDIDELLDNFKECGLDLERE